MPPFSRVGFGDFFACNRDVGKADQSEEFFDPRRGPGAAHSGLGHVGIGDPFGGQLFFGGDVGDRHTSARF